MKYYGRDKYCIKFLTDINLGVYDVVYNNIEDVFGVPVSFVCFDLKEYRNKIKAYVEDLVRKFCPLLCDRKHMTKSSKICDSIYEKRYLYQCAITEKYVEYTYKFDIPYTDVTVSRCGVTITFKTIDSKTLSILFSYTDKKLLEKVNPFDLFNRRISVGDYVLDISYYDSFGDYRFLKICSINDTTYTAITSDNEQTTVYDSVLVMVSQDIIRRFHDVQ